MIASIWFMLWGILWAIYFMLDGFDLGLGSLMPFVARNNTERRIIFNAMGPFWDGNEVWLITAGGVTFAAFPRVYAVMFSSLYSALLLVLFALIIRAVSFEFRSQVDHPAWRRLWDTCMFIGSFVPALLLGVAFANVFRGLHLDAEGVYHGGLFTLLNPYGIIGGLLFLALFLLHGSLWLAIKAEGSLQERAGLTAARIWPAVVVVAGLFLISSGFATKLYNNYLRIPLLFVIPLLALLALLATRLYIARAAWWKAWFACCLTIVAATMFGVVGLYPSLLPSRLNPAYSLTVYNSASSPLTLKIMLAVALVFVPLVITYQAWAYNLFKGKVREEDLGYEESY